MILLYTIWAVLSKISTSYCWGFHITPILPLLFYSLLKHPLLILFLAFSSFSPSIDFLFLAALSIPIFLLFLSFRAYSFTLFRAEESRI